MNKLGDELLKIILITALVGGIVFFWASLQGCAKPIEVPENERILYDKLPISVQKFYDYCLKHRYNVDLKDSAEIVSVCRNFVPYMANGRYTPLDVMAIIMTESKFDKSTIGSKKEVGLCQILTPELYLHFLGEKELDKAFDIRNNIILCCLVLNIKFFHFETYKDSLAAYNSIGNYKYYKEVKKNKKILKLFFDDTLEEV